MEVVDPVSGEITEFPDYRFNQLVELTDDQLFSLLDLYRQLRAKFAALADMIEAILIDRADQRGAVEFVGKQWRSRVKSEAYFIYRDDILLGLRDILDQQEFDSVCSSKLIWDKRQLNKLERRGSPFSDIIKLGVEVVSKPKRLVDIRRIE